MVTIISGDPANREVSPVVGTDVALDDSTNSEWVLKGSPCPAGHGQPQFLALLYRLGTTIKNLVLIFTGSAIGLMKTLLNQILSTEDRLSIKIGLRAWDEETALKYLKKWLSECKASYTVKELREVVPTLGILPGWLSFYGLRRCVGLSHERGLREAEKEAIRIAESEVNSILKTREN